MSCAHASSLVSYSAATPSRTHTHAHPHHHTGRRVKRPWTFSQGEGSASDERPPPPLGRARLRIHFPNIDTMLLLYASNLISLPLTIHVLQAISIPPHSPPNPPPPRRYPNTVIPLNFLPPPRTPHPSRLLPALFFAPSLWQQKKTHRVCAHLFLLDSPPPPTPFFFFVFLSCRPPYRRPPAGQGHRTLLSHVTPISPPPSCPSPPMRVKGCCVVFGLIPPKFPQVTTPPPHPQPSNPPLPFRHPRCFISLSLSLVERLCCPGSASVPRSRSNLTFAILFFLSFPLFFFLLFRSGGGVTKGRVCLLALQERRKEKEVPRFFFFVSCVP